jgi:hypothetical protein
MHTGSNKLTAASHDRDGEMSVVGWLAFLLPRSAVLSSKELEVSTGAVFSSADSAVAESLCNTVQHCSILFLFGNSCLKID